MVGVCHKVWLLTRGNLVFIYNETLSVENSKYALGMLIIIEHVVEGNVVI